MRTGPFDRLERRLVPCSAAAGGRFDASAGGKVASPTERALSNTIYSLISPQKSTPPQNCQFNILNSYI